MNTAKVKELSPKQIDILTNKLPESPAKEELFSVILPKKKNLNSKEIFSEIKRLSLLGLVPVVGGVGGGIIADRLTNPSKNEKSSTSAKNVLLTKLKRDYINILQIFFYVT